MLASMTRNPSFVSVLLRLEGAAALALSVFLYTRRDASWVLFAFLFLAPDLSLLGYTAGRRVGAVVYNVVHTYVGPAMLAAFAVGGHWEIGTTFALIWFAHIGLDRLLGLGLKYPSSFKETHLQRV
jgi:uncharacterized protein DUF4260